MTRARKRTAALFETIEAGKGCILLELNCVYHDIKIIPI